MSQSNGSGTHKASWSTGYAAGFPKKIHKEVSTHVTGICEGCKIMHFLCTWQVQNLGHQTLSKMSLRNKSMKR